MSDAAATATTGSPQPPPPQHSAQPAVRRGYVKQVLSGDAVVLQGQPVSGPPPETTVYLSNVFAPRLGKRPTDVSAATADEPYAWESREFLRQKLVGQFVTFVKDFTASSGRDHGRIYIGGTNPSDAENVTESSISAGFLEVRQGKVADDYTTKLTELQEQAKAAGVGKWSSSPAVVREVRWVIENPRELVDKYNQKPVDAVIEMVRDGSTYRAILLPNFEYITLQLSGVRSPATRSGTDGKVEAYAEEAKFFVEQRLLQRDIQIVLESTSNQNFVGSVLHPKGNIAESLLREGYAKCVDWSIGLCTGGSEQLRVAEKQAKEKRLRLWKSYQPSSSAFSGDKKSFSAKVTEVVLSDAVVVRRDDGSELKVHLSSVRLPRETGEDKEKQPAVGRSFRPLYDIPFMFQAREFLRKRLVGKKVQVQIDYVQPKSENFPEKTCATIRIGDVNISEALISRGLSKVVRHRADDENRSSDYDALLAAEANAEKGKKGLFADKSADKKDTLRIQEIAGDVAKAKQFLPYLQKGGRAEGVVEFVAGGSRLRVYIPKETVLITFLLGGINCPKTARAGPGGVTGQNEPFAEEATAFTRKLVLQHEVQLEVESLDKSGNFVGYLFVSPDGHSKPTSLSELLLENGLATLHFTAERSGHYIALQGAESRARNAKKNIWANYTEPDVQEEVEIQKNDTSERKVTYRKVAPTEVSRTALRFYAQNVEDGAKIEKMTNELRQVLSEHAPVSGSYSPKRGDLCAAKFSADGQWYRAKVESVKAGQADILFIDYGNRETVQAASLAQLPGGFASTPAGAREYHLALNKLPNQDYVDLAIDEFSRLLFSAQSVDINTEYKNGSDEYVSVVVEANGSKIDIGKSLVSEGFTLVDSRREFRLQSLVHDYQEAEKIARRKRYNIWEFGDFTGNDI